MLLRCLESGAYALGNDAPLTAAAVAARLPKTRDAATAPAVHLMLPAARCLVTTLPVTKFDMKHLAKTLPWTLEERLLEPTEHLHFAHGVAVDGAAPVCAINATWLQRVLHDLRAAGVQPQSACSELFMLPWQQGQWSVWLPGAQDVPVCVRNGLHAGFACARANLQTALQLLLNEQGEPPRRVAVFTEHDADFNTAELFPALLQSRLLLQRQSAAQLLNGAVLPACNVLQARFAPALPWIQWWRQWRVAAAILVALLLSDIAISGYATLRLNRAAALNEAAVVDLFRSVQPDGVVVDPRLQLEQALAAVGAAGQESFLGLLARMAPALQAAPGARVQNLEYDSASGALQVQVLTGDYAAAENLRAQLQQQGLDAELLGSSNDSSGSRTRLRIGAGV